MDNKPVRFGKVLPYSDGSGKEFVIVQPLGLDFLASGFNDANEVSQ